jgi:putative integral membrane protein (TIGR02587 family)
MVEGQKKHWSQKLRRILRSISSAFIFGVALLYTMEIWWIGMYAPLWKLLLFLIFAFLINVFIGYFAGFSDAQRGIRYVVFEATEALAIGLIAAFISLYALNRIEYTEPFHAILGKTMAVVIPFSIGAFLADVAFPFMTGRKEEDQQELSSWQETLSDIGATIAGGIFVGFPIAPTEEIQKLAAEITYGHELAVIILTLLLSYMIVFASVADQKGRERISSSSFLQRPLTETALAYSVSIILSFLLLFLFDQIHPFQDSIPSIVSQTLILALPVTIGGAAGRLAV